MNTNLFSARNRQAEFLTEDIVRKGLGKIGYFESADEVFGGETEGEAVSVFLISEDEKKNLRDALVVLEQCKNRSESKVKVYVFTSSEVARTVLDSEDPGCAEIILIHPGELMAQKLMLDHPLYEAPDRIGADELRVTIIGGGSDVPVLSKTVHWCGRMKSYIMKINIIGPHAAHLETEMKWRCPGLFTQMSQENLAMQERHLITPELYLPLKLTRTLYYQADTSSEELELALDKCLNSNYIIIDEGDDEETLRTAMAVRAHFVRKYVLHENFLTGGPVNVTKQPDICVLIRDEILSDRVRGLKVEGHPSDPGNDELGFVPFGAWRDLYTVENIIDTDTEKLAKALFPQEFTEDEDGKAGKQLPVSVRRMLFAATVHLKYKMRDMGFVRAGENDELYCRERFPEIRDAGAAMIEARLEDFKYELAALEHQRWAIYKLCDGWIPADADHALGYGRLIGEGIREHRQFAGKMNAACIEVSRLSGAGTKLCGKPSYFTETDRITGRATYSTIKAVCPDVRYRYILNDEEEDD